MIGDIFFKICVNKFLSIFICTHLISCICRTSCIKIIESVRFFSFSNHSLHCPIAALVSEVSTHHFSIHFSYTKFSSFCDISLHLLNNELILNLMTNLCVNNFLNANCFGASFRCFISRPICMVNIITNTSSIKLCKSFWIFFSDKFQKSLCFCCVPLTSTNCNSYFITSICSSRSKVTISFITIYLSSSFYSVYDITNDFLFVFCHNTHEFKPLFLLYLLICDVFKIFTLNLYNPFDSNIIIIFFKDSFKPFKYSYGMA